MSNLRAFRRKRMEAGGPGTCPTLWIPLLGAILFALIFSACADRRDDAARVEARLAELDLLERAALLLAVPVALDSTGSEAFGPTNSGAASQVAPGAIWIQSGSIEALIGLRQAMPGLWPPLILASVDRGLGAAIEGATLLPRLPDLARAGWGTAELRRAGRLLARESALLGVAVPIVSAPPLLDTSDPLFLLRDSAALAERYRAIFGGAADGGRRIGLNLFWSGRPERFASTWDRVRLEIVEGAATYGALEGGAVAVALNPVSLPALDPTGAAATFSARMIRGGVRRDADFDGLVIADLRQSTPESDPIDEIVAAIVAGADLVATPADLPTAAAAIVAAVSEGRLPATRVDAAARRVLALSQPESRPETLSAAELRSRLADEGSLRLRDDAFRFIGSLGSAAAGAIGPGAPAVDGGDITAGLSPDSLGFSTRDLALAGREMERALADSVITAGAVVVIRDGMVAYQKGVGASGEGSDVEVGTTIFDLASLSKVVGTTTAVAILVDRGDLAIDAPVRRYLPEFRGDGKQDVTIRHLLTHTSGLPSGLWVYGSAASAEEALDEILEQPLFGEPGQRVVYSDLGYILLAEIVERVTGTTLDRFLAAEVFVPLGMAGTMYLPPSSLLDRIVPTADRNERPYPLRGVVHDANSFRLQGVAGHAGIFSTAADVAQFARMMLGGGETDGVRILSDSVVTMFRTKQPGAEERALGWDTPAAVSSAGRYASANTYGHTGYTGTSLWIDPDYQIAIVLLTNRTYPGASSSEILELRTRVHEAVYQAITDREVPRRRGAR